MEQLYPIRINRQTTIYVPKYKYDNRENYKQRYMEKLEQSRHIVNNTEPVRADITEVKLRELLIDKQMVQWKAARELHCSTVTLRKYAYKYNIIQHEEEKNVGEA